MDEVKLLPCAHCGSEGRLVWPQHSNKGRVKCLNPACGAEGGVAWTFDEIERRWNTRAIEATRPTGMEVRDAE